MADGSTNVLVVGGTTANDTFLARAKTAPVMGLIALLSGKNAQGWFTHAEKVTYTAGINGGVILNTGAGDDTVALDDTASAMTINGGAGNDLFQVGQLFTSYVADSEFPAASFFSSTRGYLSRGVSFSATINGGSGDDTFQIFRNVAPLQLNGDAGDDTFIVRSFVAESETSAINGGVGHDYIQYAVNAPVSIDGGTGYDTVVVIGTEFNDTYVVTPEGVYGAGRYVTFINVEQLRVYGMEGNDTFYVEGTNPNVETSIFGGLGNDTVHLSGQAPAVQATDLLGHSGLVVELGRVDEGQQPVDRHPRRRCRRLDPRRQQPGDGGRHRRLAAGEREQRRRTGRSGSARPSCPTADVSVTIVGPAIDPTSTSRSRALELSTDGGAHWNTSATVILAAGSTAWQEIWVRAAADFSTEGELTYVLQWTVHSGAEYDNLVLPNTPVRVLDAQAPSVPVVARPTRASSWSNPRQRADTGAVTSTYTIQLTRRPTASVTVHLTAANGVLLQAGRQHRGPRGDPRRGLHHARIGRRRAASWSARRTTRSSRAPTSP